MKTLLITLLATIALAHAVFAGDWMWFHGDIGLSSPFASSGLRANGATTRVVTKPKVVTKRRPASEPPVVKSKSESTRHRVTVR